MSITSDISVKSMEMSQNGKIVSLFILITITDVIKINVDLSVLKTSEIDAAPDYSMQGYNNEGKTIFNTAYHFMIFKHCR